LKGRRTDLIIAAFLLALALVFCGRAIFQGRALLPLDMLLLMVPWKAHAAALAGSHFLPQNPMWDPVQQYYPWRAFAVASLKAGTIPLWNPYSYCGQPFLANLQSALFYPPNLIFLLLPLSAAFTWGAVIHLFLAGFFCYALLRQWRILPLAALFGAVAFMLNGYIIGWLEYPAFGLWVITWLPAILLCYEKAISGGGWRWTLLTGVVIGIQFVGGQLQISSYLIMAFLLYALWRAFSGEGKRVVVGRLGGALAALAIGLALAAVQLLPTAELAPLSGRALKSLEEARQFSLPLTHLILFLIPNFFGNPADYIYWGDLGGRHPINFFETGCYAGVMTLLLAWLAVRSWRKPAVGFLLALGVISLLLALGTPLFTVYFHLGPGAKQLAGLTRVLCLTDFALAGLAAFGIDRLLRKEPPLAKWEPVVFGLGAALTAALAGTFFGPLLEKNPPLLDNFVQQACRFLILLVISFLAVWLMARGQGEPKARKSSVLRRGARQWAAGVFAVVVLTADLFSFGMKFNPATEPRLAFLPTEATDFLRQESDHGRIVSYRPPDGRPQAAWEWMMPNTPLVYQLRDVHGYDSLAPGRYLRLIGSTDWGAQGNWPAPDSQLADLLGIRYALTTAELEGPKWELVKSAEARIYLNRKALPRAFVVRRARRIAEEDSLRMVRGGKFDLRNEVLLSGAPNSNAASNGEAETASGEAVFLEDGIDALSLQVNSPEGGWLVLSDAAYPGWRAETDEKQVKWEVADYAFRAVNIPAGEHLVKWSYEPATFKVGLFVSLVALAGLCASFTYRLRELAAGVPTPALQTARYSQQSKMRSGPEGGVRKR